VGPSRGGKRNRSGEGEREGFFVSTSKKKRPSFNAREPAEIGLTKPAIREGLLPTGKRHMYYFRQEAARENTLLLWAGVNTPFRSEEGFTLPMQRLSRERKETLPSYATQACNIYRWRGKLPDEEKESNNTVAIGRGASFHLRRGQGRKEEFTDGMKRRKIFLLVLKEGEKKVPRMCIRRRRGK